MEELNQLIKLINNLSTNWRIILNNILKNNEDKTNILIDFLITQKNNIIYPSYNNIFQAFNFFNFEDLNVVIIGQDPYHQPNQAHGLCFSVLNSKIPPSLRNINKEIENSQCLKSEINKNGDLTYLAKQNILLLNMSLTVTHSKPNSHSKYWEYFTNEIIKYIVVNKNNIVFLLWGNNAKKVKQNLLKLKIEEVTNHYWLECGHPSPLSANKGLWFNNNHFIKTNDFLLKNHKTPIKW